MGNLRQKYTDEEWDELIEQSKTPTNPVELNINKAAREYSIGFGENDDEKSFIAGAVWMMNNIKLTIY